MNLYNLYIDESMYDQNISMKDGKYNGELEESSETFTLLTIGGKKEELSVLNGGFTKFEEKWKKELNIPKQKEFKGNSIGKMQYEYGFSHMEKKYVKLYYDFLDLLNKNNEFLLQVSFINKFEIVIERLIEQNFASEIEKLIEQNLESGIIRLNDSKIKIYRGILYSIIKFYDINKDKELLELLFRDNTPDEKLINKMSEIAREVEMKEFNNKRKSDEKEIAHFLYYLLKNNISIDKTHTKYRWNFERSINGLRNLLRELQIPEKSCNVWVDGKKESIEFNAIKDSFDFNSLNPAESDKDNIIRICDLLSNVMASIIRAIEKDTLEYEKGNKHFSEELNLLDEKWFYVEGMDKRKDNFGKQVFETYQLLGKLFKEREDIIWVSDIGVYNDSALTFFELLKYYNQFKSYDEFIEISPKEHTRCLNDAILRRQHEIYE